jgi:prophage antirepressor-like protein
MMSLATLAQPFRYCDVDIRLAIDDETGQIWVCWDDVLAACNLPSHGTDQLMRMFSNQWLRRLKEADLLFVNEALLHSVLHQNHKFHFQSWFLGEVLPSLRLNKLMLVESDLKFVQFRQLLLSLKAMTKGIAASIEDESANAEEVEQSLKLITDGFDRLLAL